MDHIIDNTIKNYVFIGGSGSGKSEISLNYAISLSAVGEKVHFFDLDMSKPLFRSRDLEKALIEKDVDVHFEKQFMDAPTTGSVNYYLCGHSLTTVFDIGGDQIGSRVLGQYSDLLRQGDSMVYYVINPFSVWTDSLFHFNECMKRILLSGNLSIDDIHFIANPNLGLETDAEIVLDGLMRIKELLPVGRTVDFCCVNENLYDQIKNRINDSVFPLHIFFTYPYDTGIACRYES